MRHVVILEPALTGLIANGTVNRVMEKKEFHRITNRLMNTFRIRPDFHVVCDWGGTGWNQLRGSLDLNETHPAAAFDPDIRVIAVTRNLNAHLICNLNDGSAFFGFVYLAVDRDFGHKQPD
jgi:hypothetical protein